MTESDDASVNAELLTRYLAGSCSAAERERVAAWLSADAAHRAELDALRSVWDAAARAPVPWDTASLWGRIESRMQTIDGRPGVQRVAATRKTARVPFTRIVAWMAVCAVVLIATAKHVWQRPQAGWRVIATRAAERERVTLPDGTQLTLAPATSLLVPVDYAAGDRSVRLEGEAYFTVVHDAMHPFSVRAGNAVATDVGTQFDVRAYPGDDAVRLAVMDGSVAVGARAARLSKPASSHLLGPGDVAIVTDTAVAITHRAAVAELTAWTSGTLVLSNAPLRDVLPDLARWYGVTVLTSDSSLLGRTVTIALKNESPSDAVAATAAVMGLRWAVTGHTYTLYPAGHE